MTIKYRRAEFVAVDKDGVVIYSAPTMVAIKKMIRAAVK